MEEFSAKKTVSFRRRRLELRRLRSPDSSKRAKQDDAEMAAGDLSSSSSGFSSSAQSPPSDSDNSAVPSGILAAGVEEGKSPCISHGSVCLIGKRRELEDTVTVAPGFSPAHDFFGVYDGHGGAGVAKVCRERIHVVLAGEVERRRRSEAPEPSDLGWREAMEACFMKVDEEVAGRAAVGSAAERTVGSTAVVAVVGAERIVVANCGDSRAVLCRGGVAVPLSSDHKPDRPDEMERVEAAGGRVINWNGYRVLGVLATSRSIGDQCLKPFVTSEPEVTVTDRTERDEFLILASDGLWDVVSNEVACRVVRLCLSRKMPWKLPDIVESHSAAVAAATLAKLSISRGSWDNVSVVVVELRRLHGKSGTVLEDGDGSKSRKLSYQSCGLSEGVYHM